MLAQKDNLKADNKFLTSCTSECVRVSEASWLSALARKFCDDRFEWDAVMFCLSYMEVWYLVKKSLVA